MNKHFIVLCPCWVKTGGPEALHQLAFNLHQLPGVTCSIFYYGKRVPEVIQEYQSIYPVPKTEQLNQPGAHIVFPEGIAPDEIPCPSGGSRWVWWLSANRHFLMSQYMDCGHLFQSEYARQKITALGAKGLMLTDYIREIFTGKEATTVQRQPWIAYNAAKSSLAALILSRTQQFALLPIQHMEAPQVRHVLSQCKIYMDFGAHPGRDRLPREAALNGCMIITGRDGAAGNDIDIPIPDVYKISVGELPKATSHLLSLLDHYDEKISDFHPYRKCITQQRACFQQEIEALVSAVKTPHLFTTPVSIDPNLDHFLLQQEFLHREREYLNVNLANTLVDEQIKGITRHTPVNLQRFA